MGRKNQCFLKRGYSTRACSRAWRALLAQDDSVALDRIPKIIIKFDAVHQHTTYYRSLDDALAANSTKITAKTLQKLNDRKVASLGSGVWMGAYCTPETPKIGKNAIRIAITEYIYPAPKEASETELFGVQNCAIRNPIPEEVASTKIPLVRHSIWPVREFVAEYYGLPMGTVIPLIDYRVCDGTRRTLPVFRHKTGLVYQIDANVTPFMECVSLIRAGTWEFFIPDGESPEYWGSEYTARSREFLGTWSQQLSQHICNRRDEKYSDRLKRFLPQLQSPVVVEHVRVHRDVFAQD